MYVPHDIPDRFSVVLWLDPMVEAIGFDVRSDYVEFCWLGLLGPTATWLVRRLGAQVNAQPGSLPIDLVDLSVSLGLGEGTGRNSLIRRSLDRMVRFGVAEWHGEVLAVRRKLAPLNVGQAGQLSYSARLVHEHLTRERAS